MADGTDDTTGSIGPELTRRRALAGLGAVGALGVGGLSTAIDGADSPAERTELWLAQRRRKFAQPGVSHVRAEELPDREEDVHRTLWGTPTESLDELTTLEYLGASWEEYGNPAPETGQQGAWQHTFLLTNFGMAQQLVEDCREANDRTSNVVADLPARYTHHRNYSNVPTLRVEATEDAGNVAVSPLRDEHRFGFFRPDTFETEGAFTEFARGVAQNRADYVADYGAAEYVMAANRDQQEDFDAAVDIAKGLLSLHPKTAAAVGVLEGAYGLFAGIADLLSEPEGVDPEGLDFYEGFEQRYPGGDLSGPYCGGFVTFHVYVAPDRSGTVEVSAELDHVNFQPPPRFPTFRSDVTWTVEVGAAPPPSEASLSPDEKHNARVVDYDESAELTDDSDGTQTHLPDERTPGVVQEYDRPQRPAPSIVPAASNPDDPQEVADGTRLTFHAHESAIVGSHVDSYEWDVHYTSPADGAARQYTDLVLEESYVSGDGPEFSFDVEDPDDPSYTNVHTVHLTVTDEAGQTGSATYRFTQGQRGEPEGSIDVSGDLVQFSDVTLSAVVEATPTTVEAFQWEVTSFPFDVPQTAPPWTGSGPEFQITPPQAGSYAVSLTMVDGTGATNTVTETFRVEEVDPSATITSPGVDSVTAGVPTTFAVDYGGIPNVDESAIEWTFPEATRTGRVVQQTFDASLVPEDQPEATIDVSVRVPSATSDAEATASTELTVRSDDDMAVTLEGPDELAVGVTETVRATVSGAETDVNYGFENADPVDSSQRTSPTRPVTFEEPGEEEVSVTVVETGHNNESASDSIAIDVQPFTLSIDGPTSPKELASVRYEVVVEGDAGDADFEWDAFGETHSGTSVSGTFDEPGDRTVSVSATADDGTELSASLDVSVRADSDMTVSLDGPDELPLEETGTVEATVSNAEADVNYGFDNADPVDSSQRTSPTRPVTFEETGEHEVSVTASETGDNFETASDSITIDVYDPDDDMSVSLDGPSELHVGETGTIEAKLSGVEADVNYAFSNTDPVDSGQRTSPTRELTPRSTGQVTVSVTAQETADNHERASAELTVDVLPPDVTIHGPSSPKADESVTYSASVVGDPDEVSYEWAAFGRTSTGSAISGTFDGSGSRTVELTATVYDETVTTSRTVDVYVDDDMSVSLSGPSQLDIGETGTVEASVSGAEADVNYGFENADSVDSSQRTSPTRPVTFDDTGTETVSVTASETGDNHESASDSITIDVVDPDDDMSVSLSGPSELEVGETGSVYASVSGAEADVNYAFSNVDSTNSGARTSPSRSVTYSSTGTETVSVDAFETGDNHERASDSISIDVVPAPDPSVSIGQPTTPIACSGSYEVSASVSDVETPVSYDWTLDGSSIGSGQSVEFTVATNGEKTLSVEIEDADGNTASDTRTFYACASTSY